MITQGTSNSSHATRDYSGCVMCVSGSVLKRAGPSDGIFEWAEMGLMESYGGYRHNFLFGATLRTKAKKLLSTASGKSFIHLYLFCILYSYLHEHMYDTV